MLRDSGRVLLDLDVETLRASALTVTGPTDRVATLGRQHELLSREVLGDRRGPSSGSGSPWTRSTWPPRG